MWTFYIAANFFFFFNKDRLYFEGLKQRELIWDQLWIAHGLVEWEGTLMLVLTAEKLPAFE